MLMDMLLDIRVMFWGNLVGITLEQTRKRRICNTQDDRHLKGGCGEIILHSLKAGNANRTVFFFFTGRAKTGSGGNGDSSTVAEANSPSSLLSFGAEQRLDSRLSLLLLEADEDSSGIVQTSLLGLRQLCGLLTGYASARKRLEEVVRIRDGLRPRAWLLIDPESLEVGFLDSCAPSRGKRGSD